MEYVKAYFLRKNKLYRWITWEFLELIVHNFQDIILIWTRIYSQIFKSALV